MSDFPFDPVPGGFDVTPPFVSGNPGIADLPVVTVVSPNSDRLAGGIAVTITGLTFRKNPDGTVPTVLFGANPATNVVVVSSTQITCNSPAATSPAVVDVSVTIGSQIGTLKGCFTYYTSRVIKVSPGYGPLTGGTAVVLEGDNFVAGSTVTFAGVAATGVTVIDAQHIACVTPNHGLGFVDVVVTEPSTTTATLRNGFQYTLLTRGQDIRRMPSIMVRDILNNAPNTCSFTVDGQSNVPQVGEQIQILDGATLVFAGNVQTVEQVYEDDPHNLAWNVTAIDYTWLLNRRRPFGIYTNASASDVVIDLIAKYAPGFTVNHVQTKLARVTCTFDGARDFATCLSDLCNAIGEAHWYVDYTQDVHFYHLAAPPRSFPDALNVAGPTSNDLSPVEVAGAALTVAQGDFLPLDINYSPGYFFFWTAPVYSNGVEGIPSLVSNFVAGTGQNRFAFSNVPVYANAGSFTCVKRRLYGAYFGTLGHNPSMSIAEIQDNSTTSFQCDMSGSHSTVAAVVRYFTPAPVGRNTAPPVGPATSCVATQSSATSYSMPPDVFPNLAPNISNNCSFTPGRAAFKVAFIYRDGTESQCGPASNSVPFDGQHAPHVDNVPVGPTVNGVDVVGRRIYWSFGIPVGLPYTMNEPDFGPGHTAAISLIPDNTTISSDLGLFGSEVTETPEESPDVPAGTVDSGPHVDGPFLEDDIKPDNITDASTNLLHDPAFTSVIDLSQIRNRVNVRGAGSTLTIKAAVGDTTLNVADTSKFPRTGGTILIGPFKLRLSGVDTTKGAQKVFLQTPLPINLPTGTPIYNFLQVDHVESQQALGRIEVDKNGAPTDGIHEYTITDPALITPRQLFNRGFSEIELFSRPVVTIRYATRDPKSRSGRVVNVDLTNPPCKGEFLIQEVTIDQFYDESDQVSPRYSVVADSAARFNFNDLLLYLDDRMTKIITAGGGITGLDSNDTVVANGDDLTDLGNENNTATLLATNVGFRIWTLVYWANGAKREMVFPSSEPVSGASSSVQDARGQWHRINTGASAGGLAELRIAGFTTVDNNPIARIRFRMGPDISSQRVFVTMSANSTPINADLQTNGAFRCFGLMYSSVKGGSFVPFSWDGTSQITGGNIYPVQANGEYMVEISVIYAGIGGVATITLYDKGAFAARTTLALNQNYSISFSGINTFGPCLDLFATKDNANRFYDWTTMYCETGLAITSAVSP